MLIYKITNRINGKVCVGQTNQPFNKRIAQYKYKSKKPRHYIEYAINKYGFENFEFEKIDEATNQDELNDKEKYWIKFYNSNNKESGYNITDGGENYRHSYETKQKLSKIFKGKRFSPTTEFKKGNISPNKGKPVSEERKKKFKKTWEEKMKYGYVHPNYGKIRTEETKQRYSKIQKEIAKQENYINPFQGKQHSEETRRKMSELKKGKTTWIKGVGHTKETCQKMVKNSAWRKPILCIEDDKIYSSIGQAAIAENCSDTSIGEVCRGQAEHFRGKHYKFVTREEEKQYSNSNPNGNNSVNNNNLINN